MRNIQINDAETIFEPFWDSGESYEGHKKYSVLSEYNVSYNPKAVVRIYPMWAGVNVEIQSQQESEAAAVMERDCNLEIAEFDIFRLFAAIPASVSFKVIGTVDGERKVIINTIGNNSTGEYDGYIRGKCITHIRIEFSMTGAMPSIATLYWFGLSNSDRQKVLENRKSPYTSDWKGCFEENPTIGPRTGIYFGQSELEGLRERVKKEPFKSMFEKIREEAVEDMLFNPEEEIDVYLAKGERRWERDRDIKRKPLHEPMQRLAFVGIVEGNAQMLKMACRYALSAAHHTYWCESIMGVFPGATWHHRSFTEEVMSRSCALVLDWAGSLLTWHGRNIIYDAIIMKGLPRMEADFKTMEYIREMNQGIVFSSGRIPALLALTAEYPRYRSWLKEAELDLEEIVEKYVLPDGGTLEGPTYWNYTFKNILPILYILARYHGKTLREYASDKVVKTGDYALSMMSQGADHTLYLPVNDAHWRRYNPLIPACYSQISDRKEWKKLYARTMADYVDVPDTSFIISFIIMAPEAEADREGPIMPCGFTALTDVGQVSYVSECDELGRIKLHLCSGPTYRCHYHQDKGSFIIEAAGEPLAIDRGVCQYFSPYVSLIGKASAHNLFMPESDEGFVYNQPSHVKGGVVTHAAFCEGVMLYTSDNKEAWESGLYNRNYRRVFSPDPQIYIFNDDVAYLKPSISSFRLNTKGTIAEQDGTWIVKGEKAFLRVIPVNWVPHKAEYGEDGYDEEMNIVNQLRLFSSRAEVHNLVTAVEILPYGRCSRCKVNREGFVLDHKQIKIKSKADTLQIYTELKLYEAFGGAWRIMDIR